MLPPSFLPTMLKKKIQTTFAENKLNTAILLVNIEFLFNFQRGLKRGRVP